MKKRTILLTAMLSSTILLSSLQVSGQFTSSEIAYADSVNPIFVYDKDGLKVTVNKVEITENDNYRQVDVYYTQENTTSDKKLSEITFALFLEDGTKENQYGFFGDLFPKEKTDRVFSKKLLKTQKPMYLEIDTEFLSESVDKSKIAYRFENSTENSETLNTNKDSVDNVTDPKDKVPESSSSSPTEKDQPVSTDPKDKVPESSSSSPTEKDQSVSTDSKDKVPESSSSSPTEKDQSVSTDSKDKVPESSSSSPTEKDQSVSTDSKDKVSESSSSSPAEKDQSVLTVPSGDVKEIRNQSMLDKSKTDESIVSSNKNQKTSLENEVSTSGKSKNLNSLSKSKSSSSKRSSVSSGRILPKTSAVK